MDLVKDRVKKAWRSEGGSSQGTVLASCLIVAGGIGATYLHKVHVRVPWTALSDTQQQPYGGGFESNSTGVKPADKKGTRDGKHTRRGARSAKGKRLRNLRDSFDELFDDEVFRSETDGEGSTLRRGASPGEDTESGMESVLESDIEGPASVRSGLVLGAAGKHVALGPLKSPLRPGNRPGAPRLTMPGATPGRTYAGARAPGIKAASGAAASLAQDNAEAKKKRLRVGVNMVFFRRLVRILRVCIPTWNCKEVLYIAIYSALLVSRTFFSMAISELSGYNAEMLVSRNWPGLFKGIARFFIVTIPTALVNSGLKYIQQVLSLALRQRLSAHVNRQYIRGVNFYKATNLGRASSIDSADQRVTSDIEKFTTACSEVYGVLFKPILDVSLFSWRLRTLLGWQGPALMYGYFGASAILKKIIMPPLGKLSATESALEGQYRTAHQRLIVNSEEVSLYEGARTERAIINQLFRRVIRHTSYLTYLRFWNTFADGLLIKYWATIVGYAVMASPMIFGLEDKLSGKDSGALTADYIRNTSYLMGLAASIGQIVLIGNKVTTVAGYTARVSELLEMVNRLDEVGSKPFVVVDEEKAREDDEEEHERLLTHSDAGLQYDWIQQWHARREQHKSLLAKVMARRGNTPKIIEKKVPGGGVIRLGDKISFEDVNIVSPDGKMLAEKLNFEIKPGENVMVTGPNGSGKSSLSRLLGELWPVQSGVMTKPTFGSADKGSAEVMFVPQKPYMVLGTLRDQLLYPHTRSQADRLQVTDEDLMHLLDMVDPNRIITTSWNFDEVRDWVKTFSGGQRQRVSMARLFYHKPRFAVLDECTNAMSDEIEDKMYEAAKALQITLFTVSHRVSLQRHHEWQLLMLGNGKWEFKRVEASGTVSHGY